MTLESFGKLLLAAAVFAFAAPLPAQEPALEPLGPEMEGFPYPYAVSHLPLAMDGRQVRMAYMDVAPAGTPNGRTAVLFHGRNFGGYYWENTIRFLSGKGYRVVIPDQIGFGKSSKPEVALSFHGGADHTRRLLDELGVDKVTLVAHSMGSMFAMRYALMFPQRVEALAMEGPIGLEDYRLNVPYATKDELAREAAGMTREGLNRFYRGYFVEWKPEYQVFADVAWRWTLGPAAPRLARVASHTYQMAFEQPVIYELPLIKARTLLVAGDQDRSAIGRNRATPEARESLGRFTVLIPAAAKSMPDAKGVILEGVGHIPHLEATDRFHALLEEFLARQ
ncbi:MAG TPA: alpha/beta hydrolase [Burkholderiales bacterium]